MTHTAYTAELSDDWDLTLDGNGDLSMIRGAQAICQNVFATKDASSIMTRSSDGIRV